MPLVRVSLRKGKSDDYKKAIGDGVYQGVREAFNVPEEDRFVIVSEHSESEFQFSKTYLDIARIGRSGDPPDHGQQHPHRRAEEGAVRPDRRNCCPQKPGLRKEDVFINLVDVAKENWSFGNGVAQYA